MDENITSDKFAIAQNNIYLDFSEGVENFYYTFFIVEKRRKVTKKKFNEKGELISETIEDAGGSPMKVEPPK